MTTSCDQNRKLIPKSVLGDLQPEEQTELDRHLVECVPCAREYRQYADTIRQLRSEQNEDVPRHFFVYPGERTLRPWQAFFKMSRIWQVAAAAVLLAVGLFSSMAIARLQVRMENGILIAGFGKLPESRPSVFQVQTVDEKALEFRLMRMISERNQRESLELARSLRAEMARSNKTLSREQTTLLAQVLDGVELRMTRFVAAAAGDLERKTDASMQELYRTVSLERANDRAAIENRINLVAANGEIKDTQTDAILETLLQVAEARVK